MTRHTFALFWALLFAHFNAVQADQEGFRSLFNGRDLEGWDGDAAIWTVEDGCITAKTAALEHLPSNQFLVWRGGTLRNFELRVRLKSSGNRVNVQYRSHLGLATERAIVGGYQCVVHPKPLLAGMLCDESTRGILARNGQSVVIDPEKTLWLVGEHDPVLTDAAEWHTYTIIAVGNHLIHKIDGKVTIDCVDHEEDAWSLEGLLAFQICRGPAIHVQIAEILLKNLPDGGVIDYAHSFIPSDAQVIEEAERNTNEDRQGNP